MMVPPASTRAKIGAMIALHFIVTTLAVPVALPGCPEACGNVIVPYPFGIGEGCFRDGFNVTCDSRTQPPKLLLGDGVEQVEVIHISLDGTVRINTNMLNIPFEQKNRTWSAGLSAAAGRLTVSTEHNRFVALGCDFVAGLVDADCLYLSVCATYCTGAVGVSCCQASCHGRVSRPTPSNSVS
jgi:hypothetical protein